MNSKQLFWLILLIPTLALFGCEGETGPAGPAGPPGADGTDGTDGADATSLPVCLECHNDTGFLQIAVEYSQSGHKAGEYVDYAGGRASCAQCHSKQGFMEFAANGDVQDDFAEPAAIDCATCHLVHPNSFALRLDGPVPMIALPGYDLDFTNGSNGQVSNLCANCHQARTPPPSVAAPGDSFTITSTHYGPHHGPQGIVLEGVGMSEIAGSTPYPTPGDASGHLSVEVACVNCHMATYDNGEGGHTWNPSLEFCQGCHIGATSFDINGYQTEVAGKLDELRDILIDLGILEYVEADDAYEPVTGRYPMLEAEAYFNWIGLEEDRSLGAHNPGYYEALLDNTLEALSAPAQ